jgi:hypothetical protein
MRKRLAAVAFASVLLAGCGATKIGKILDNPGRYQNRDVAVEGTVTAAAGAYVAGGYQVDDGTGKIYVVSIGSGVPRKGAKVRVKGRVTPGVTLMGRNLGTAIREREHDVKY